MTDSGVFSRERCQEIFGRIQRAARAGGVEDVEAMVGANVSALTRFANNAIHQNVSERAHSISVRAVVDDRTARATTNRLDDESLREVVSQAIAMARAATPDPDLLPLAEPDSIPEIERFHASTAGVGPGERAAAVAEAIRAVESAGGTAAGIFSTGQSVEALLNSRGLFAYYFDTLAQFSITAMAQDSSGWAKQTEWGGPIDAPALALRAARKAKLSANPAELAPGRYTVILEPSAVLDLTAQMYGDFSATAMHDQRSFLTGRMGKKLFGENITIHDDVRHPLQCGAPFDGEGVGRKRLTLVEKGTIRELAYSRQSARREGTQPTGHGFPLPNEDGEAPVNIVIEGGDMPLEQMVAGTERGILVTRLWYIREVDPYEKIMTGMTRDGTFLIEGGKIKRGLRNFRFNQGLIELLSNVEALSPSVRASGEEGFDMIVPAMKVREFNFTEVTRF
jgi:predicted Zn-dependent protease